MRRLFAKAKNLRRRCKDEIKVAVATILAHIEPRRPPLINIEGLQPLGPRVALFCHFDRAGRVALYVRKYLESLHSAGYAIVFVSNSGAVEPEDRDWLVRHCAKVIVRKNIGYDFSAWRDGLEYGGLDLVNIESLLILNDSVYGPFEHIEPLLEKIDYTQADVWGCTDSWQMRHHLQSYFLAFGPKALKSDGFQKFWNNVLPFRSKLKVIRAYEIGLTQKMLRNGLRCQAIWPYTALVDTIVSTADLRDDDQDQDQNAEGAEKPRRRPTSALSLCRSQDLTSLGLALSRRPMNPVCDLWRALLDQGFPFIKRELLRDNPTRTVDIIMWRHPSSPIPRAYQDLILSDLSEVLKNRAP